MNLVFTIMGKTYSYDGVDSVSVTPAPPYQAEVSNGQFHSPQHIDVTFPRGQTVVVERVLMNKERADVFMVHSPKHFTSVPEVTK